MTTTLPALSEEGWVQDPSKTLDLCLSYYITTDAQQSVLYRSSITSLPATYQRNSFNPDDLRVAIQTDLEQLLGRYFVRADVQVQVQDNPDRDDEAFILIGAIVFTSNGSRHELNRITQITNSVAKKVTTFNNFGQAQSEFNQLEFQG